MEILENNKMKSLRLSIVIPAYNESATIERLLEKIKCVNLINGIEKEIIIVNDFSEDNTDQIIRRYVESNPDINILYFLNEEGKGKGAALRTGIRRATGDYLIVQDADLEYDPEDYNILLRPIVEGIADVVYGSRFKGTKKGSTISLRHFLANKFLTFLSNIFTKLDLTDMETCYKLFKSHIIKGIILKEDRFGFEPEVTAKISRIPGIRIHEVGISYSPRSYREGKKIGWIDGVRSIFCILKYNLFS
jgi:glycosyltransferase involved in cell wall biosynthesis